jgi:hypothetical protein
MLIARIKLVMVNFRNLNSHAHTFTRLLKFDRIKNQFHPIARSLGAVFLVLSVVEVTRAVETSACAINLKSLKKKFFTPTARE